MISVCMASYNGAKYIHQQIESILCQLSEHDELIISDDGSSDDTIDIINRFNDGRIKLYSNNITHGVNGNFENALKQATGDIIFLADQDDVWLPGKLSECLKALEDCDCVIHDAIVTDGNLNPIGETIFEMVHAKKGVFHNWLHNGYLGCAMAFKRHLLDTVLPIPKRIPMYHDIWIGQIAGVKFKVKFLDYKGIYFRRHNNTTSVTAHKKRPLVRIIRNRLSIVWYVGKRILFNK